MTAGQMAEEYVRRLNSGNYADIVELFADAAVFCGQGVEIRGKEAIARFYPSAITRLSPSRVEISNRIESGNSCSVELDATYETDDGPYHSYANDIFTVDDDGRITRLAVYVRQKEPSR